ncbi:hypothetical protein [Thermococcus sp.]|uniref:hypothetical protein n=1 Tax=Thermococcus sp. TaxID=35749 RepID=UPI002607FFFF|nr:hypothetical protein [Thermococcus sp.]
MKAIRGALALSTLALAAYLLSLILSPAEALAFILPALLAFLWPPAGYLSLTYLGFILVYRTPPGGVAVASLSFSLIYVESVYLMKRKAPLWHYIVLTASVILAVPLYYVSAILSGLLPSLVNTVIAALFVVILYMLLYTVIRR